MREGWHRVALGELIEKRSDFTTVDSDTEYVILGVKRSGWGFVEREPIYGREQKFTKLMRVEEDDLVYRTITAFEAPSGVVGPEEAGLYVTPQTFPVFRIDEQQLLPEYMRLLTKWPEFHAAMAARCTGSVLRRKTLSVSAFRSIPVALPSPTEQRRITNMIAALDRQLAVSDEVGSSLEEMWWTLAGQLEAEAAGTEMAPLGSIAAIHGGLTKNKKDADRPDAMEAPYLRVANVLRHRLDLSEVSTIVASRSRIKTSQLEPGDLLMAEGGDRDKLGRGAVWRGEVKGCTHQNHVFRARITDEGFHPEFVSSWANSFGKQWFDVNGSQTTGIASISKATLSRFPVPRMTLQDQERWAELLDGVIYQEDLVRAQVERLSTLRANLLTALLSGEHEIPETYDELLEGAAA